MASLFIIVLLSCLCGLSVTLNVTAVIAIISTKKNKDVCDVILMSLAVSDGVECIFGFSVELYGYATKGKTLQNETLCKINGFIVMYLALTSISHLVCLCLYRYILIVHSLKAQRYLTNVKQSALYFIIPSWIYGLFWSIAAISGWNEIIREKVDTHRCTINMSPDDELKRSYLYSLTVFCFLVPVVIIIYCSLKVHLKLQNMWKLCVQISGEYAAITKATYKLERKHFIFLGLIIGSFFVVWTPYALCVFFLALQIKLPRVLLTYSALFAKSSTIINPTISCIIYKEYFQILRIKVQKLFRNNIVSPANL
ncbi:melanopsin-A [Hydra vulgaris]|uniref:Opsin n=1 Tax=Hydra vulgaris TaxID=6087 RepID=A0A857GWT4_HYDVU|nr:melanopsin-A-like [Hydra vulgaris]QHF16573.1 opsin [Hydra vulgaris]